MVDKNSEKENCDKMPVFDDIDNMIEIEDIDDDEVEEEEVIQKGKKSCFSRRGVGSSTQVKTAKLMLKSKKLKGLMDSFVTLKPEKVVELRKHGKMKQTNINDKFDKEKSISLSVYWPTILSSRYTIQCCLPR